MRRLAEAALLLCVTASPLTVPAPASAAFFIAAGQIPPRIRKMTATEAADASKLRAELSRGAADDQAAVAALTRLVAIYSVTIGVGHYDTERMLIGYIKRLEELGHVDAADLARKVRIDGLDRGTKIETVARMMHARKAALARNSRFVLAHEVMRDLRTRLIARGAPGTMVRDVQLAVAGLYVNESRFAEADLIYRAELSSEILRSWDLSPDAQAVRRLLASNLDYWGKPAEAASFRRIADEFEDIELSQHQHEITTLMADAIKENGTKSEPAAKVLVKARRALRLAELNRRHAAFNFGGGQRGIDAAVDRASLNSEDYAKGMRNTYFLALHLFPGIVYQDTSLAAQVDEEAFRAVQGLAVSAAVISSAQTRARALAGSDDRARLVRDHQDAQQAVNVANAASWQSRGEDGKEDAAKLAALRVAAARFEELDRQLRAEFPGYFELVTPRTFSIAAVQAALREDEAVLLLIEHGNNIFQFGVSKQRFRWRIAHQSDVRPQIGRLACQLDPLGCPEGSEGAGAGDGDAYDRVAAHDLYQKLVQPMEDVFGDAKHLYVQATGRSGALPLGALLRSPPLGGDGEDPKLLGRESWMADRYALTSIVSVEAVMDREVKDEAPSRDVFRGFGAPTLEGQPGQQRGGARRAITRSAGADGLMISDPGSIRRLDPLPGTRIELESMARALGAPAAALSLGDAATETVLKADPLIATARIVAFATHGIMPGELSGADEPGLILTPPTAATANDDGFLAASEVGLLQFSADWLILSACNTATASGKPGMDSLSSLARSFLYAGADSLLASRWRIGDQVTATLTVEALRLREQGLPRSVALQGAMRAVRTGMRPDGTIVQGWLPDWAHPSAWAPFSVFSRYAE